MSMENTRRVLTIGFEFEITDRKAFESRLRIAYEKAVTAATAAVRSELLEGSVSSVRTRMSYDYRLLETSDVEAPATEWPEAEDVESDTP